MRDKPADARQTDSTAVSLKTLALPDREVCSAVELYFQCSGDARFDFSRRHFCMDRDGSVSSAAYFNLLATKKICDHTIVERIGLQLRMAGRFLLTVRADRLGSNQCKVVAERIVEGAGPDREVDIFPEPIAPCDACDALHFQLTAVEDGCRFFGGQYSAVKLSAPPREPAILFATTAFRRAELLRRNEEILEIFFDIRPELRRAFDFLAVDNGCSLSPGSLFRVLPNANLGSSGGCARAMIEAMESDRGFTHLIYSDDDIILDPTVLENVYLLLRVLRDEDLCIAGAMLRMEDPTCQYEMGARFERGSNVPLKHDLRVTSLSVLLENEREERIDYAAWWMVCFSVSQLRRYGLPLPLFIRGDDVEYGCRATNGILTMNGIAVWHESFEGKFAQIPDWYFSIRNALIHLAVRRSMSTSRQLAAVLAQIKIILSALASYRYRHVQLGLAAVDDFLKGPEYVFDQRMAERLKEMSALTYPAPPLANRGGQQAAPSASAPIRGGILRKFFLYSTFSGHILPPMFSKGTLVVPLGTGWRTLFPHKTVVYYDPASGTGIEVKRTLKRGTFLLLAILCSAVRLLAGWPRMRRLYRAARRRCTTTAHWKHLLETADQKTEGTASSRKTQTACPSA